MWRAAAAVAGPLASQRDFRWLLIVPCGKPGALACGARFGAIGAIRSVPLAERGEAGLYIYIYAYSAEETIEGYG